MGTTNPADNEAEPAPLKVVCLGASAGGLEALTEFFVALPSNTGAAVVVVVHLSPDFKSLMPELLAKRTKLPVRAAEDQVQLEPDHVYIIPPGSNMMLCGGKLQLQAQDRRPGHVLNLPIDLFLTSMAEDVGARSIAVILSGSGSDGSRGVRAVKEAGGAVLAQTPASARFDGMPLSARQTGLVDAEGTPDELARQVEALLADPQLQVEEHNEQSEAELLEPIVDMLARVGPDLSYLRPHMMMRRTLRRMTITGCPDLQGYIDLLRSEPGELRRLGADLLIGVTQFFRDPDAMEVLRFKVLPRLLAATPSADTLRVWVAACSTGQEAYTLIMLLLETMESSGIQREFRVFATDIDEQALQRASTGIYTMSEVADIKPGLLGRYFEQHEGTFSARPALRGRVIFARHNVVTDPPFTKMDLVTCRNLLIYLRPEAQRAVLSSLYWALRPARGVLILGAVENVGDFEAALPPIDAQARIYERNGPPPRGLSLQRFLTEPITVIRSGHQAPIDGNRVDAKVQLLRSALEASFEADRRMAALIDRNGQLLDTITDPIGVLKLPKGRPTNDLISLLPSGVATAVLAALSRTENRQPAQLVVPANPEMVYQVVVQPLPGAVGELDQQYLLLIAEKPRAPDAVSADSLDISHGERILALEDELRRTKESLQATIEELQSASEEQQSTNEELVASNEELQSTNEELHSVNEELITVNAEYQRRNQDLVTVTSDLDNLLRSIEVGTLYLDSELRIRRFTPGVTRLIPLRDGDIGRAVSDFLHRLDIDLVGEALKVLESGRTSESEVRDQGGSWLLVRASAYCSSGRNTQGVLITMVDVTRIKNAEEAARVVGERLAATNARLAEQAGELEDLLSIVAHDLKRPVLALDGMLELVKRSLADHEESKARSQTDKALKALASLRSILNDLTKVSQQTRAPIEREDVQLAEWLDAFLQPFAQRANNANIRLQWATDGARASFARSAASVALTNLIENAFVHGTTSANPRIDVVCRVDGRSVILSVSDNGRGIAPEDHKRVFELFRRLRPDETEGTGVGLVAARRLAWRAGGNVTLESKEGEGAKFTLVLPTGMPSAVATKSLAKPIAPERVLLVEDNALDAERVRRALKNYQLDRASRLSDARQMIQERRFDMIILDVSLPDGHGLGLLSDLATTMNRDTPVILLSGHIEGLVESTLRTSSVVSIYDKDTLSDDELIATIRSSIRPRVEA